MPTESPKNHRVPGPWEWKTTFPSVRSISPCPGLSITHVRFAIGMSREEELVAEATANVMAAAPEMLDALGKHKEAIRCVPTCTGRCDCGAVAALAAVNAAIDKAQR